MIIIEPLPKSSSTRPRLSKRELQRFLVEAIAAVPVAGAVSVLLTDDAAIRDLNRRFRKKDKATDVLSFEAAPVEAAMGGGRRGRRKIAGDLAVSLETAARQAEAFGHPLSMEVKVLLLHGLLHLSGLDHDADNGEMAAREQELREQLGLPTGLIQRSSAASLIRKPARRSGR